MRQSNMMFYFSPILVVGGLFFLKVAPEAISDCYNKSGKLVVDLYYADLFSLLISVALCVISAVVLFVALRRGFFCSAATWLLALSLSVGSIIFTHEILVQLQQAKLSLYVDHFRQCSASAKEYAPGKQLKICLARFHGDVSMLVVFDSGGSIDVRKQLQPKVFSDFLERDVGPLLSDCSIASRRMRAGFYLIEANCS